MVHNIVNPTIQASHNQRNKKVKLFELLLLTNLNVINLDYAVYQYSISLSQSVLSWIQTTFHETRTSVLCICCPL